MGPSPALLPEAAKQVMLQVLGDSKEIILKMPLNPAGRIVFERLIGEFDIFHQSQKAESSCKLINIHLHGNHPWQIELYESLHYPTELQIRHLTNFYLQCILIE